MPGLNRSRAYMSDLCRRGEVEAWKKNQGHSLVLIGRSMQVEDVRCQVEHDLIDRKARSFIPSQNPYLQFQLAMKTISGARFSISC